MTPSEKEIAALLDTLCVKLGFCLPSNISARLIKFPPKTSEKFAKSVIEADRLNLESIEKNLYKSVLKEIESVFEKEQ